MLVKIKMKTFQVPNLSLKFKTMHFQKSQIWADTFLKIGTLFLAQGLQLVM